MIPKCTQDYLNNGAPKGQRNDELMKAACQWRDERLSLDEAVAALLPRALADGLSEQEAISTLRSVYNRAPREPAGRGFPKRLYAERNSGQGGLPATMTMRSPWPSKICRF